MQPRKYRVLIIGAYGQFGRRIAAELSRDPGYELALAGRNASAAQALCTELEDRGAQPCTAVALDVECDELGSALAALQPQLVIHTAGPFQQRSYSVAEAALNAGAHYVDLADGREFVGGITALDPAARARGRWVISGASSVPGLSAAVVESLRDRFARLESVTSAISPGNRTPRGLATTRAILGYVGRPFPALVDGRRRMVHGWQSLERLRFPSAGARWVARCDVPDLDLLPQRFPELRHCDFRAGLELKRMHHGLWLASWLVRAGLIPSLARWAEPLLRISEHWLGVGSDTGLMLVELEGTGRDGRRLRLQWRMVAEEGSGPQIPATAAVVLAGKLSRGELPGGGARPCLDLFTLEEYMRALERFPIRAGIFQPSGEEPIGLLGGG
jgi:saccharopine dehydrogenase-like NADP-dependent oxidoreductase